MNCISILRKLRLLPDWFRSELEEADSEDIARSSAEHARTVERAESVAVRNRYANGKLLESVRRVRSSAFAEFENSVRQQGGSLRDR